MISLHDRVEEGERVSESDFLGVEECERIVRKDFRGESAVHVQFFMIVLLEGSVLPS